MNKKYLSVILFGALMLGTTGAFTSCKDYDDDINQINKELTDIKSAISELQSKVDNGKYVTNITKEGEGIKITWNDNSTSVIETIKGDKGADGTIVTIVDGYWAFDGVKSEYPAVGKDGAAGADGEDGKDGADGHDAKISEDGYWMVWDAEKGEYAKTEYIAGGVTAVETAGGWKLTVRDDNGEVQTIFIPTSSTMGYIDVLGNDVADYPTYYELTNMKALYGINEKDVEYGPADAKKIHQKGLYTTLDRDLMIVVNPQGTDASDYTFALMNSANVNTGLLFKDAVPYEGVLSRATSANGVWVLPHKFTRYEDIEDARTKNYLLFKANDGAKHALSLTATLNNTTVKTPYDLGASLKKIGDVKVVVNDMINCEVGKEYVPTYSTNSIDANAVYDYWLTFEQSAANLKAVELYGADIVDDGHAFTYTRETGVNNSVELVYNYILMNGTVVQGDKAPQFTANMGEVMATEKSLPLERLNVAFNAEKVVAKDNPLFANSLYVKDGVSERYSSYGEQVFVMNTQAYPLTDLFSQMSDVEKVVWKSAIEHNSIAAELIGGEGDNNGTETNTANLRNIGYSYSTKDNTITFQFAVSRGYKTNFLLNNAYELTFTALDEDTQTPVASIILPFEFTQPDIETVGITHQNGDFTKWTTNANGETVLYSFGAYGKKNDETNDYMYLPFHEAFDMWIAKDGNQYADKNANALYYNLKYNYELLDESGITFMGSISHAAIHQLQELTYSGSWWTYTTFADRYGSVMRKAIETNTDASVTVSANYYYYGVYPATMDELGYYIDNRTGEKNSGFQLVFASTIKNSTLKMNESIYYANAGTNDVFISNDDVTATTALNRNFVLFDGIKDNKRWERATLNNERGFNEAQRPFAAPTEYEVSAKYVNGGKIDINGNAVVQFPANEGEGEGKWVVDARGVRTYELGAVPTDNTIKVYAIPSIGESKNGNVIETAHTGGLAIQLGTGIEDRQPIEVTIKIKDTLGFYQTLKVVVQKLQ